MDPITIGALITAAAATYSSYESNRQNRSNADEQMKFQREMAGTQHQREIADLRAAGLNPMLSALGAGAAAPQGAMAQDESLAPNMSKGMETALAIKEMNKRFEGMDATISNTKADTMNKQMSTALIANQSASTAKDIEQKAIQTARIKAEMPHTLKKLQAEGKYAEAQQLMGVVNSGASALGNVIPNPLNIFKGKK
nr:MAG: DNA pilot protein [Microvirus sp.]